MKIYEDTFDTDGNNLPKIIHSHTIDNEPETETLPDSSWHYGQKVMNANDQQMLQIQYVITI